MLCESILSRDSQNKIHFFALFCNRGVFFFNYFDNIQYTYLGYDLVSDVDAEGQADQGRELPLYSCQVEVKYNTVHQGRQLPVYFCQVEIKYSTVHQGKELPVYACQVEVKYSTVHQGRELPLYSCQVEVKYSTVHQGKELPVYSCHVEVKYRAGNFIRFNH